MGKIIGEMTGRSFKFCGDSISDLEHCRNWLIERGLMANINKENYSIEVTGYVNGTWKEDVEGNLFLVAD